MSTETDTPTEANVPSSRHEELINSLDPALKGKADYGASAARKGLLSRAAAPNHVLAAHGVEVPHRTYLSDADDRVDRTTTAVITDSSGATVRVHLHQDVREADDDGFGSFGAAEEDTDDVIWTVVGLDDGVVDLTVVGEWSKRRSVPFDEFADDYEPIYLSDGQPRFGY